MSVVLYQMAHSPYAVPIRQALTACGVTHETREVPNWDRQEVIKLTGGAYYQIPVLTHDGHVVFESGETSLQVARYIDTTWAKGCLFPENLAAPNLCLTEWIENEVEGCTFKLAVSVPITNCDSPVSTVLITPSGPWRVIDQVCISGIYQSPLNDASVKCL